MSHYSYATSAYGYALDQVEECLRTGREPFITNQNLAQMRMYHTSSIQHSSEKMNIAISKTWIISLCFILFAIGGGVEVQGNIVFVPFLIVSVSLSMWAYERTIDGLISRIGGGVEVQQKESAKILNALIKKSL